MKRYRKTRITVFDVILLAGIITAVGVKAVGGTTVAQTAEEIPNQIEITKPAIVSYESVSKPITQTTYVSRSLEPEERPDYYPMTDEEREMVIQVVAAESRGESFEGQKAVCQVILDRCIEWNQRPIEILKAERQFAKPYRGDLSEYPSIAEAVDAVFVKGERVFEDTALYFFNPVTANQAAVRQLREYNFLATIGNHEFRGKELIK